MKPLEAVETLIAAFQKDVTPDTVGIYASALSDLDPELLAESVRQSIATSKFFPTIAEIRRAAARIAGILPPSSGEILAMIRRADVRESIYRRDGSFAYTERYWRWPGEATRETVAICEEVIRKAGEPCDEEGNDIFDWDLGARKVYESELPALEAASLANLTNARLTGRTTAELPPARTEAPASADSLVSSMAHGIGEMMRALPRTEREGDAIR